MSAITKPAGEYEKLPKIGSTSTSISKNDVKNDCVVHFIENKSKR